MSSEYEGNPPLFIDNESNDLKPMADWPDEIGNTGMNLQRALQFIWFALFLFVMSGAIAEHNQSDSGSFAQKGYQSIKLTREERVWLQHNPDIRLTGLINQEPAYIQREDGEVEGIIADQFELLGRAIGQTIKLSLYNTAVADAQSKLPGNYGNAAKFKTPATVKRYLLTNPYLYSHFYLFTTKEKLPLIQQARDLRGKRVAAIEGHRWQLNYLKSIGAVEIVFAQSPVDQMKLVSSGEVDAMIGYATYQHMINKHFFTTIYQAFMAKESVGVSIGVNPEHPLLHAILNKAIATVSKKQRSDIRQKWLRQLHEKDIVRVELTEVEQRWLAEHPVIHLFGGILPPLDGLELDGTVNGIGPDYTDLIAKKLGVRFEYSTDIWTKVHEKAKRNEIDGIRLLIPTKARESYLNFTKPYTQLSQGLLTLDSAELVTDLSQIKGKKVGALKGAFIHQYLEEHYPEIEPIPVETFEKGIELLINGQIDAMFGALLPINYIIQTHHISGVKVSALIQEMTKDLAIGVRKDWPELIPILNKAISSISPEEHREISRRWGVEKVASTVSLTAEERAWLKENPVIRLGSSDDFPPIGFIDKSGTYSGIAADYISSIEDMLDVRFELSKLNNWKETVDKALSGELDMLGSAVSTPQRDKYLTFTRPYLSYPLVIFTRMDVPFIADMSELNGQHVAVNSGSAAHELLQINHPEFDLYPVKDTRHGLMSVANGEADVFIGDLVTGSHIMADKGLINLKISGEAPYRYDISMAIHKGQPLLASILQKALDAIPEEKHNEIYRKWLSVTFEHKSDYTFLIGILILVIFVFITALLWIRHTQVKNLTAEIEGRKAAEVALRESEAQFRMVVDKSPVPMVMADREGNIEHVNHKYVQLFGWSTDDNHTTEEWWSAVFPDPDYRRQLKADWERAVTEAIATGEEIKPLEWILTCKSGEQRDVILNMVHVTDDLRVTSLVDITERKASEKRLQYQNVLFNAVLESPADISIFVVDNQYNYLVFNSIYKEEMLKIFGSEVQIGINLLDSINSDELRAIAKSNLDRALSGESFSDIVEIKKFGIFFEINRNPLLSATGVIIGVTSFARDVTDRVKAEKALQTAHNELDERVMERTQELSVVNESLQQAKELAESANRAKNLFLSKMSHELRTPMNAILGYAQILYNDTQLTEKQRSKLKIVLESGDHLTALISDILDLAQIEANQLELNNAPLNIQPFLNNIVDVVQYGAKRKGLSLVSDIDQLLPSQVIADEIHLRQILLNLLSNAIKFTNEGSVTLQLSLCNTDTDVTGTCCLRFMVEDTGIGISKASQQEIFNSFVQLRSDDYGVEGTGLGLTISHRLVVMMGGELKLTSEVGGGSRFWFELELPVLEREVEPTVEATSLSKGDRDELHKIMVVDDIDYNRDMLRDLLEGLGFVVIEATGGAESLELAQREAPDLILMDLVMPNMDGYQAVAALRLFAGLENIPVVAVSASITEEERALASGFNRFISKPVDFELIKKVLNELLHLEGIGEGVSGVVDEINMNSSEKSILDIPPAAQLNEFKRLLRSGKIRHIIDWADTLEAGFPEYEAFARQVRMLAEQIDVKGLMDMLAQHS